MPVLLPKEDTLILASLTSRFCDYGEDSGVGGPPTSGQGSRFLAQSSGPEMQDSFMQAIMHLALEWLHTVVPQQGKAAPASAFFSRRPAATAFAIPLSENYLKELQACWGQH